MLVHVATPRMRTAPSDHGHGFDGAGFDAAGPAAHGFEVQGLDAHGFEVQGWDGQGLHAPAPHAPAPHAQVMDPGSATAVALPGDAAPSPAGGGARIDPLHAPMSNGEPQGQCFGDVVTGVVRALDPEYFAGHVLTGMVRGVTPQIMMAEMSTHALLTAGNAAIDAYRDSPACQTLDNAAEANRLGLAAIGAP